MKVVLQHIETSEKFIFLNQHIFNSLNSGSFDYGSFHGGIDFRSSTNECFTVIDLDGNIFGLNYLDQIRNIEYYNIVEFDDEMDDSDNSEKIEYISYRQIKDYRVIEIDGKSLSELLK